MLRVYSRYGFRLFLPYNTATYCIRIRDAAQHRPLLQSILVRIRRRTANSEYFFCSHQVRTQNSEQSERSGLPYKNLQPNQVFPAESAADRLARATACPVSFCQWPRQGCWLLQSSRSTTRRRRLQQQLDCVDCTTARLCGGRRRQWRRGRNAIGPPWLRRSLARGKRSGKWRRRSSEASGRRGPQRPQSWCVRFVDSLVDRIVATSAQNNSLRARQLQV